MMGPLDRLRIERAVQVVDTWIGDLPGRRRRQVRAELRADLLASAEEVGAREAVRRLGPLRRLAAGYLDAEFGDVRPRPSWAKGMVWAVAAELVLLTALFAGTIGFSAGLDAVKLKSGTYRWAPLGDLGPHYVETWAGGQFEAFELDLPLPAGILTVALVFVMGGRMWRTLPLRRAR